MGPREYLSLLIIFYTSGSLGNIIRGEEEDEALKYVAQDDVNDFETQMGIFGDEYGKKWMVMPDGNGMSQLALLYSPAKAIPKYTVSEMPEHVKLYLYTKKNPKGKKFDPNKVEKSDFDASKPTKMICHGWMASSESSVIVGIRDAYLENQDVNVIGVDWSSIAKDFFYPTPAGSTDEVGKYLASLIDTIVEKTKTKHSDFHLIGHSLGAHVTGFTGNNTKRKVGRITGLDPALPGFQFAKGPKDRLDPSDANFVDVIHTCAGILGMSIKAGHVDFYPNGGSPYQPGCSNKLPTSTQACSHSRSHEFFAESIRHNDFKAVGCSDWDHFKKHKCKDVFTLMGEYTSPKVRGPFYLKTDNSAPFALGINGTFY